MERISGEERRAAWGPLQHAETVNVLCDQQLRRDNNLATHVVA